ncbi:hypothetical protein M2103_001688 [Ereboglobus sp. PH5-5]|uniref:TonB-dependent receptor n=1 Tax=unclassified Ereboglobus TaxID=2626932 RepID=UPI0024057D5A|nr:MULTISPECIES: TonB-dependent receptor [unclassified Ereboglobus]MDF9827888.1 hypothetical protein [Ereboglobus sp. PH5-10]MDF9833464.1 hypothetical protein [Ereboglobus sp. PH5-5]
MLPTTARITRMLTLAAITIGFAVSAHAQAINTAPISGVVRTEDGRAISGAKITITHNPTSSVTRATSDSTGYYGRADLRPGGPYTVSIAADGYASYEVTDVYLAAESGAHVPAVLPSDVVTMEKYTVSANSTSALFDPGATDKSSFISTRDIQNMVAGDRTLGSLLANDPRVVYNRNPEQQYISVSGINNRYNQIMVDGVSVADPFGLNSNNLAAQNNVIPIEAIESIAVSTSPYNARKGGFTGAYVNVVTKSGGNDFHGSVYYTFRNQDLVGEHLDGKSSPVSNFKEQTYGASLRGPIIPKKLFFMGNIERKDFNKPMPSPAYPLANDTMRQLLDGIAALNSGTAANGNVINTGTVPFDVGTTDGESNKIKNTVATAKLEWQVNNDHRITAGYQYSEGSRPSFPGFGSSGGSSQNNFSFSNSWYNLKKKSSAITGAWTANWSDKLYTEVNVGYKKYDVSNDYDIIQPYVQIQYVPVYTDLTASGSSNAAHVMLGTDNSYQTNELSVKTRTIEAFASYKLGHGHTIDAGFQYNTNDVYNLFVQNTAGYYVFNSWNQFNAYVSGSGTDIYTYRYNKIDPDVDAAANFTEANVGMFVRDVWRVGKSLTLDINLRMDIPVIDEKPAYNQKFYDAFKIRNDSTYDGQVVLQPRLGFNWQPKINSGKLKTVIRGGVGLFYGGMPRVWLGNSYSNTGFNYTTYECTTAANAPTLSSDPNAQPTSGVNVPATQSVSYINSDFQLPTRWKGNIAFEQELPWWGMKAAVEIEHTRVDKDVFYRNMNIVANTHGEAAPDGRPMYWARYNTATGVGNSTLNRINTNFSSSCIELTNSDEGQSTAVTLSLERPMKSDGWQWMVAYTHTNTIEAVYGNSSVALSCWRSRTVFDPNAVEPHRGDGEIRHRVLVNITKRLNLFSIGATTLTLTYNGHSGLPYSLRAYNDVNGDGQYNDIMYIPSFGDTSVAGDGNTASNYIFASAADRDTFYKLVKHYGLAEGQKTKVNGQRYPWVNQFDLHIAQQIKLPGWRHKLELAVDVLNVGNMLNDKWGLIRGSDQAYVKSEAMANVVYDNNTKKYTYSRPVNYSRQDPWINSYAGEPAATRWSVLLSVRYLF